MKIKKYSQEELEILLREFQLDTPLSELEAIIQRPVYSIIQKMQKLSQKYPQIWDREKVAQYVNRYYEEHRDEISEYQRRYREEHKERWKIFGDYLNKILETYNGKKIELASELNIHPSTLSNILIGNRKPNEEVLRKISERFNVPYKTLKDLLDN